MAPKPKRKRNTNLAKAVRAYQAKHPGTPYPAAKRAVLLERSSSRSTPEFPVPTPESLLSKEISGGLRSLVGKQLSRTHDGGPVDGWWLELDRDLEEPIEIVDIVVEPETTVFEIHETLDDGGELGEARISATITYEAAMHKADYYGAADDVRWWVVDEDHNDHYVLVQGEVDVELIVNVVVNGPEEFEIEYMGVEAR